MSELEIQELHKLQEKINILEKDLNMLKTSGINRIQLKGHTDYDYLKIKYIVNLEDKIVSFLIKEYAFHFDNLKSQRDILCLCEKQTPKSVFKPINILDK